MRDDDLRPEPQPVIPAEAAGRAAPSGFWFWAPWIAVAGLALLVAWLLLAYVSACGDLAAKRSQLALSEVEGKALRQQLEAERILFAQRLVDLLDEFHARREPSQFRVVPLASRPDAPLAPTALVVLNPDRKEGELVLAGLPALPPDKAYQLWIADSENGVAVSAAVFTVGTMPGGYRVPFRFDQLRADASFIVSVEPKGGAASRQGPVVLVNR